MLSGAEVKSLRGGHGSLAEAFARVRDGEVWLEGMHIPPYAQAADKARYQPTRPRKLLLHRKEIGIMKLVGATNWRIRMPFLVEGLFESFIGAIAAILFLFAIKVAFINPLNESVQFIPWIVNRDVIAIIPILLIAGAIVALLAGLVGMRRFLDV